MAGTAIIVYSITCQGDSATLSAHVRPLRPLWSPVPLPGTVRYGGRLRPGAAVQRGSLPGSARRLPIAGGASPLRDGEVGPDSILGQGRGAIPPPDQRQG